MVALPIGHPLTQKEKISSNDLSNENFVLYRRSSGQGLYDNILYSCYQAGLVHALFKKRLDLPLH